MKTFDELVHIVERLRGEDGCPWDRAQTPQTLRPYVLEEAFEVVEAIDRGAPAELRKELGDVLFQVVLLARMAQEAGWFDLQDVVAGISKKMVDRHPHVFGSGEEDRPGGSGGEADRIRAWEERKAQERESRASVLDGVPQAMPALLRAHKVSRKAAVVGFDWPDRDSVRKKVDEELEELDAALAAGDEAGTAEEFGDLLFTLVNLGRHLPSTAEDALRMATSKFETRFRRVEDALAAQGRSVHATPLEELEALWQAHKKEGRQTA